MRPQTLQLTKAIGLVLLLYEIHANRNLLLVINQKSTLLYDRCLCAGTYSSSRWQRISEKL